MIFETGVIFETVNVIQCSRNASNETNIKFSIYLEQNLLRTMFLGSRLSSGGAWDELFLKLDLRAHLFHP